MGNNQSASKLFVAGLDEAGRGPLAGPVTAACVVLSPEKPISGLDDSKSLSAKRRAYLYHQILEHALAYSIVSVGPRRIASHNIRGASLLAMRLAAARVSKSLSARFGDATKLVLLVDGNAYPATAHLEEPIIKGDSKIKAISAASILAKVERDKLMEVLEERYPGYGFAQHKGYPTAVHLGLIKALGPCPVHRRGFRGVSNEPQQSSIFGIHGGGDRG